MLSILGYMLVGLFLGVPLSVKVNRVTLVKKIRLRSMQPDTRIFREVNALSRLSHRFIVRYYTTWVEASENTSHSPPDSPSSDSESEDDMTSVPHSKEQISNDHFSIDMGDLDDISASGSFPSIHFEKSWSGDFEDEDSDSDDDFESQFGPGSVRHPPIQSKLPAVSRTLYIQMVGPASRIHIKEIC
jgi:eukaryotic translation initiation factor 2-alpha kinase 4